MMTMDRIKLLVQRKFRKMVLVSLVLENCLFFNWKDIQFSLKSKDSLNMPVKSV